MIFARRAALLAVFLCGCGGSATPSTNPLRDGTAQVRFVEGAPVLEALVGGVPTSIGTAYLTVGGQTVASSFPYGVVTPFVPLRAGTQRVEARDSLGYSVGPPPTTPLAAGKRYTVILVGTYPQYRALTFEEPSSADGATLAVYAASPALPTIDFGTFAANRGNGFKRLGTAHYAQLATVSLGKSASNLGGYVGKGTTPIGSGTLTLRAVDAFDPRGALPFHAAGRFSLFLVDPTSTGSGPLFGSLDR